MDTDLWSFVTKFRESTDSYNFTSQIAEYHGKFKFERKDLDKFWSTYCDIFNNNKGMISGMAEKPRDYQPLLVDVDLEIRYDEDEKLDEKLYTIDEVKEVIKVYQKVIKETVKEWKPRNCVCYLLEKNNPYVDKDKIKGGFHLHFPRLWIRTCDHDLHILPRIIKYLNEEKPKLFKRLNEVNTGNLIDKGITKKHWLLYGSRKAINKGSYMFTKAFDCNVNEITLGESLSGYKLLNAFEEELDFSENPEYYLPRILSTQPNGQTTITYMKTNLECVVKQNISTAVERTTHHENLNVSEAVEIAKELMAIISPNRADHYDDWLEMGWVLYSIGDGCKESLDLWIEFSSKTSRNNFDESYCVYQ